MLLTKVTEHAPSRPSFSARYLESRAPIHFPEEAEVPESKRHLELRTVLYQLLARALPEATAGSDQFVYYDASDPKKCVAPDVYLRLAPESEMAGSWKVWERGAPEIAIEFVSEFDRSERSWLARLQHYRRIGVRELLRFNPEEPGAPLRIWDRVEGQLLEREVTSAVVPSSVLQSAGAGLFWAIAPAGKLQMALRIASGPSLEQLIPTSDEALRAAEARVAELEAELRRR